MNALSMAALGTGFTFLMTAAGASVVFFFRKEINHAFQRVFLGFAAGVMVAASVWSLLIPAIEMAEEAGGLPGWVPAAGGFLGLVFGLTSFFQCFGASPLGVLLLGVNPLGTFFCCVVNRVLVGVIPGLLYRLLRRYDRTKVVGIAICCFLTCLLYTSDAADE